MSVAGDLRSNIKPDEVVRFFPTYAWRDGSRWLAAIHGWVYEPELNSIKRRALVAMLQRAIGLRHGEDDTEAFRRRAWTFLVDNERGKHPVVRIGEQSFVLPRSGPNGHFEGVVHLPEAAVPGPGAAPWIPFELVGPADDARRFQGRILAVEPAGLSVISDIDDTIKVTDVHSREALLRNTFLREFEAVDGMAAVYRRLADRGAVFHYVSASPWQLQPRLEEFLERAGYPAGTFHLQCFRWTDSSVLEMITDPHLAKPERVRTILQHFPGRRFVLIGDSRQEDPEIYAALARHRPDQVERVLIRNLTGETPDNARCTAAFQDLPAERWQLFRDPAEITLE